MHKTILDNNLSSVVKQRNMFLLASALLLGSNVFLGIHITNSDQKIVMVPALRQEMSVTNSGVSRSYLEEMSLLFLSNLLDLSSNDIDHKRELILKYTVSSDKKALKNLLEYFITCSRDYKRFGLSTYYSVKNLEIDLKSLTVISHGILTSNYGKSGYETSNENYKLEFEYQGGSLRLKSFTRIIDEEKLAKDKAKNLKYDASLMQEENNINSANIKLLQESNNVDSHDEDEGEPK